MKNWIIALLLPIIIITILNLNNSSQVNSHDSKIDPKTSNKINTQNHLTFYCYEKQMFWEKVKEYPPHVSFLLILIPDLLQKH